MSPGLDAFLAKHDKRAQPDAQPPPRQPQRAAPGAADAYARAALDNELAILAATAPGGRNDQLNVSAFNIGQLVGAGLLDREYAWDALRAVALSIGLDPREVDGTLRSAFEAGERQPRDVPPAKAGPGAEDPAAAPAVGEEEGSVPSLFPIVDWAAIWDSEDQDEWIVYPVLPARRLVALFSPPKIGKSLLMLEIAVAVSRGEKVLGKLPDEPHRVLYVDFENDPRGDVVARLKAMGRKADELGNLHYLSFPRLPMLDTPMGALTLMAVLRHYGCDVVVIDTISRAVGGDENENDTWLNFYRHTGLALKAEGVSTIRLDHTGKDHTKGMRGGSAKYGDVDAVWSMQELGDSKLRLECTANRLPITEKVLVVERRLDPLRHEVSSQRTGDANEQIEMDLAARLDTLGLPFDGDGSGYKAAKTALDLAGDPAPVHRRLQNAVARRKRSDYLTGLDGPGHAHQESW